MRLEPAIRFTGSIWRRRTKGIPLPSGRMSGDLIVAWYIPRLSDLGAGSLPRRRTSAGDAPFEGARGAPCA